MTDTKTDDNEKQADEALGEGDPDREPSSSDTSADGVSTTKMVQRNELDGDYVVPVFRRIHAFLRRRLAEEHGRALRAEEQRNDAYIAWERSLTRLDNIAGIVENEKKKIDNERQRAENESAELTRTARKREELFELELDAEKARLIAERKRHDAAGKHYDEELNPPPEPPDPIRAGLDEISKYAEYEKENEEWWQKTIEEAGGEEHVSPLKQAEYLNRQDFLVHMMERKSREED
ncbi:MAG: hypothetical protein MI741_14505 [Rhodospirillales bacterium]|nr:hypothetical protein [Rhodospirillales bacterium]